MIKNSFKTTVWIVFFIALGATFSNCVRDKKLVGVYKTSNDDTLKLIADHSFRIELTEPDTTLGQFKIATGRWHTEKRKLKFNMDSRSMGQYWECQPFSTGWRRLSRPAQCSEGGDKIVFRKIKLKKKKKGKTGPEEELKKTKKKKKKKKEEEEE
jgi:hypothetical protein